MTVKYEKAKIEIILYNTDAAFVVADLSNGGTYTGTGDSSGTGTFGELFK